MPDTLLGGIAINEVLVDPNGANNFDTDGNGAAQGGDEFLELINTSGAAIDISGLELWDAGQGNWFTFPSGPPPTVLEAGARAVVVRNVQFGGSLPSVTGNDLAFDADFGSNVFNNGGDNLVVYDPTNDEYIQATYNGEAADDPPNDYAGFSTSATQSGAGEDFGSDQDGFSIQRNPIGFTNDATPTPGAANVCFTSGTLIEVPKGFVQIEALKPGDLVCTKDAGPQRLEWIYARHVTRLDLLGTPNMRPVVIPGQAGDPAQQLRLSRHHRVLVQGKIAQRMFGVDEILVPAKDLVGCNGIYLDPNLDGFCYYHLLLTGHQILNASGVAAESLFLGKQGLNAMSQSARNELATIFPDLADMGSFVPPEPVRRLIEGKRARRLGQRYDKNKRMAVAAF